MKVVIGIVLLLSISDAFRVPLPYGTGVFDPKMVKAQQAKGRSFGHLYELLQKTIFGLESQMDVKLKSKFGFLKQIID